MSARRPNARQPAPGTAKAPRNDSPNAFGMRSRMIAGAVLAAALLIGCGGWAATAHLDGAVVANGSVKVDRNLKAIQHRDGGIVKAISIREGDIVRKGQVLIALEDVQTRAELSIVRSQVSELTARRARFWRSAIHLNISRSRRILPMRDLSGSSHQRRTRLFHGNRTNRRSQTEQLEFQITAVGRGAQRTRSTTQGKGERARSDRSGAGQAEATIQQRTDRKHPYLFDRARAGEDDRRAGWHRSFNCPRQGAYERDPRADHRYRAKCPHRSAARAQRGRSKASGGQ